ncbi:hypothetical protein DPMN_123015 [Dreissena polymorpha]|uniref:Nephrocystin-4 n=1 Tax=Dreissena polymorpha TaxID=45954 RepID=A0A9D4JUQ8_DREPO|nr:hypothetical protein DPMN_123015 [Dreissena polymorpha]
MERIEITKDHTSVQTVKAENRVTLQNGNNNVRKRADFFREYLETQKKEVVIGGYTPTIEDSNNLKGYLVKNTVVRHLNESVFEDKCVNVPLCIGLTAIDNVVWPHSSFHEVEGVSNLEFQLRVSLFDLAYHQFFGRQWAGQYEGLQGVGGASKPKLRLSQNIYFHTNIKSSNIAAVVELVASGLDENSRLKKVSCGWGVIRPFKEEELPDTGRGIKQPIQKCQLYYGSPRALFFIDEPFEDCQHLRPIPDCQLGYTIATHKALYKVQHLLPQNTVVGHNDVIPGLYDSDSSVKDKLKKPKALKSLSCTIEQATLQLNPTIEKFEEELCNTLHEDRRNMANKANDGSSVVIVERRLVVGVHNGWTFVEKPQTFLLDSRDITTKSIKPSASPMFRRSQRFKSSTKVLGEENLVSENFLILNQKIHVQNILEDPMFAVVFILEYIVGEQLSDEDRKLSKSLQRGNTRSVTLRWAAWNPFLQPTVPHVTVGLIGGPTPSPDGEFMYKVPNTAMQDQVSSRTAGGLLAFQWGFGLQDSISSGTHPTHPMSLVPGFPHQMGSAHSMRSGVTVGTEGSDIMMESPSQKPPTGRQGQMSHRSPPGQMSLSVPQQMGAGGVLQPVHMTPMQYPVIGYPQAPLQQSYIPYHQGPVPQYGLPYGGEIHEMQQHVPAHQPILTSAPVPRKGSGLSRAAYAKLYSCGFPPVLDRNGEPPEVIDPNTHVVTVDLQRELNDPLQCNEIIFQFLAYSRMMEPSGASSEPGKTAGTVFFSFQFYRNQQVTTERLLLSKAQNDWSSDATVMPYILSRLDKDGTLLKGPPGLEVRYFMDPAFMKPGETPMFLQHVAQQTMFIDVWDGDSLLPLGSAEVDLKYLCRCGMEAVQTTFELDVYCTEYQEDPGVGPEGGAGGVKPTNMFYTPRGRLHLRMANIGHPVDPKATTADLRGQTMPTFTMDPSTGLATKKRVARAHHMAESNREVAAMLFSKQPEIEPITESNREVDSERQRKLARMAALRNQEGGIDKPQTLMAHKQLKTERARDLKTLEIYRLQTKKDGIQAMLSQSISTEHTIHPSFGASEFFEFVLRNPFNVEHHVKIEWEDKALQCVTDAREWRYFKQVYQIQSQIEEGMFNKEAKSASPEVFLRPKETVNIPFKYLMFKADQSVNPQVSQHPLQVPHVQG